MCRAVVSPLQADDGSTYEQVLLQGDVATLHTLRRLGVPWQPTREAFTRLLQQGSCSAPAVAWMLAEGCPMDWVAAEAAAKERLASHPRLAEWLRTKRPQSLWARLKVRAACFNSL